MVPVLVPRLIGQLETIPGFSSLATHSRFPSRFLYRRTDAAAQTLPRLLMFHGSYYDHCPSFYTCAFQESYGVHNYENILNLPYYFNVFQPEYGVVSTAQYATTRNHFNYDGLCTARLNPPLETVLVLSLSALSTETVAEERLTTISFRPQTPASFGCLVAEVGTALDLIPAENGGFTCPLDNQRVCLGGAQVFLFP